MTREEEIAKNGLINVYPHMTPEEIALGEANKKASHPWGSYPYTPNEFYNPAYPLGWVPGSIPPWYIQGSNSWENPPGETFIGQVGNQFFVTDPRGGGVYSYGRMPDKDIWNYATKKWEPNPAYAPYIGIHKKTVEAGEALKAAKTTPVNVATADYTQRTTYTPTITSPLRPTTTTRTLAEAYSPFPSYYSTARTPTLTSPLIGPGFTRSAQGLNPTRNQNYTFGAVPNWYYG